MKTTITQILVATLGLVATAAFGGEPEALTNRPPIIESKVSSLHIPVGEAVLWDYEVKGTGRRHNIGAPVFNLDGRDVTLRLSAVKAMGPARELPNGCREHVFVGEVQNEKDLCLQLVFRLADESPVVRFRYEILSDRVRHLTKPAGTDQITYLKLNLADLPAVAELRLSEFNELVHSYVPVERAQEERNFSAGEALLGPILLAGDASQQMLVAFEHGSSAPDTFLRYRLAKDRSVTLQAVKGNYFDGQEIGPGRPFSTIWFELAAVRGERSALARSYRDFVLRFLAESDSSRQPWIFYNTWNYQERRKHWMGRPSYHEEMTLERMLREIDVAHAMGIDVFVVDAGWFQKTGDWLPDLKRFPDGLKQVRAKLDGYGMKLGLWFDPPGVAMSSRMLATHEDCVMTNDGKRPNPGKVWESEESIKCCVATRFGPDFADKLIELSRELGVTYFKWDNINQYGCSDGTHGHGTSAHSVRERSDCYAFRLPLALADIAARVSAAVPDAICDFDMTESGRCFGLAFLSAGKYFLVNNGPYFKNYDFPASPGSNNNIFFFPGPARGWICRTPLSLDEWIPSVLFLTHYLPDDPAEDQMVSLGSLVLGQNGIWGDLPAISPEGVARFGKILAAYKQVRDDITRAYPVRTGPVGGSPEVHEKIAPGGRGVVVIFGRHGSYRYITSQPVDRRVSHYADTKVSFDDKGRAIIDVTIPLPPKDPKAGYTPKTPSGARLVFFGVDESAAK